MSARVSGRRLFTFFTQRRTEIHHALSKNPNRSVRVIQAPDALCAAYPNLEGLDCQLNGVDSEIRMKTQSADVMVRLGIEAEVTLPWKTIRDRIGQKIKGSPLYEICDGCLWDTALRE